MNTAVADKINNQILTLIAKGTNPWQKGWASSNVRPFNPITGHRYNGLNAILCAMYTPEGKVPAFTTVGAYCGRFPKKGSKALAIIQPIIKDKENAKGEKSKQMIGIRYTNVFSVYDIQGFDVEALEKEYLKPLPDVATVDATAEAIVSNMPNRPAIKYEGASAFYRPADDSVTVPARPAFKSTGSFYGTLFHELAHSTGHVARLDRKEGMENIRFGSEAYSKEELIAELTACYICSDLGVQDDNELKNSAAYLQGWIKPLQNDPTMIIKASSAAVKAAQYIMNVKPEAK